MKMKISDLKDGIPYTVLKPSRGLLSIGDTIEKNGFNVFRKNPYEGEIFPKFHRVVDVEVDTYAVNVKIKYYRDIERQAKLKVARLKEALK